MTPLRSAGATFALVLLAFSSIRCPAQSATTERLVDRWQRQYETWRTLAPPSRLEDPQWSRSGALLTYRDPLSRSSWILIDCRTGKSRKAFDQAGLATAFTKLEGRTVTNTPSFSTVVPHDDGRLLLNGDKKSWWLENDGSVKEAAGAGQPPPSARLQGGGRALGAGVTAARSPKGQQSVEVRDGDIYLTEGDGMPARKIGSWPADATEAFVGPVTWSPSGRHFALWRERKQPVRLYKVVDSAKGLTREIPYEKPGDARTERWAWVIQADGKEASGCPSDLCGKAFSAERLDWSSDGKVLRTEYVRRGFTGHGVISYDVERGVWRKLLAEEDSKFVYTFNTRFRHDLSDELTVWASERTGWRHLYAVDLRDGSTLRPITTGRWVVKQVVHFDPERQEILFVAVGLNPGENPYHHHLCKVRLDGTGFVDLTPGDADHQFSLSPDRSTLIDLASKVDSPPVATLRSGVDGRAIAVLLRTDTRRLETAGWSCARPFVAKDREGKFDIWGVVTRPHPFDPSKKYPVIENIYAGPHGSFAPKSMNWWSRNHRELSMSGFYVVQMDGRGTNHRGKEFHQQSWRNLKDGGFPDRIAWLRALAKVEPGMDLDRVGIFGGSAGGQNTAHALLLHGDFYKAGAADCGCYDNRVDKLWWNEQWLGWPVGPWYEENACATYASRLSGRLLLTLGESDTNVDVKCTYDFHAALLKAGKQDLVELHVVPGAGHGAGESGPMREKRARFFMSALGGPIPR